MRLFNFVSLLLLISTSSVFSETRSQYFVPQALQTGTPTPTTTTSTVRTTTTSTRATTTRTTSTRPITATTNTMAWITVYQNIPGIYDVATQSPVRSYNTNTNSNGQPARFSAMQFSQVRINVARVPAGYYTQSISTLGSYSTNGQLMVTAGAAGTNKDVFITYAPLPTTTTSTRVTTSTRPTTTSTTSTRPSTTSTTSTRPGPVTTRLSSCDKDQLLNEFGISVGYTMNHRNQLHPSQGKFADSLGFKFNPSHPDSILIALNKFSQENYAMKATKGRSYPYPMHEELKMKPAVEMKHLVLRRLQAGVKQFNYTNEKAVAVSETKVEVKSRIRLSEFSARDIENDDNAIVATLALECSTETGVWRATTLSYKGQTSEWFNSDLPGLDKSVKVIYDVNITADIKNLGSSSSPNYLLTVTGTGAWGEGARMNENFANIKNAYLEKFAFNNLRVSSESLPYLTSDRVLPSWIRAFWELEVTTQSANMVTQRGQFDVDKKLTSVVDTSRIASIVEHLKDRYYVGRYQYTHQKDDYVKFQRPNPASAQKPLELMIKPFEIHLTEDGLAYDNYSKQVLAGLVRDSKKVGGYDHAWESLAVTSQVGTERQFSTIVLKNKFPFRFKQEKVAGGTTLHTGFKYTEYEYAAKYWLFDGVNSGNAFYLGDNRCSAYAPMKKRVSELSASLAKSWPGSDRIAPYMIKIVPADISQYANYGWAICN